MARRAPPIERLPVWVIILTCATITAVGMGIRQAMGLYVQPISNHLAFGIEVFSISVGISNIVWGIAAPFTGAISDKYGAGRVVVFGGLCTVAGLLLLYIADSAFDLYVAGVMLGLGVSGAGINTLVGAAGRAVAPEMRAAAVAKIGIGSGIGLLIALPYSHLLIETVGWQASLVVIAATALVILPLAWPVSGRPRVVDTGAKAQTLGEALAEAFTHPSFWLLNAGFFVCGFHVVFYAVHLPSYVASLGLDAKYGVIGLTVVGIGNLIGSYLAGQWGRKRSKKWGLSFIYLGRAVVFLGFLYLPIDGMMVVLLSAALGLFWLSTIPLTSSLVSVFYGPTWMPMLYGIVFFSHQVGSFMGAWMAGYLYDRTQSYDMMWWISVGMGVFAALIHIPIVERQVRRKGAKLTARQDAFVRAYLSSGDARLAYLQEFGPDALVEQDVDGQVNKLLSEPVVRDRIAQMRDMNAGRLQVTIERLTAMLLEDRAQAQQSGQYAAAVAATVSLAQLHGKISASDGTARLPDAEAAALEAELIQYTARGGKS
ncbi:MAG: MFS transporter [Hyphomicrobiaceae bacterium]